MGFPGGTSGKESACQCRKCKRHGSIPVSERSPGEGSGNPLQYSCLENPKDTGAWRATVHSVAESRTQLKQLRMLSRLTDNVVVVSGEQRRNSAINIHSIVPSYLKHF